MAIATTSTRLANNVPIGGSFLAPYPAGHGPATGYSGLSNAIVDQSGNVYGSAALSNTGAAVSVVNNTGRRLLAGETVVVQAVDFVESAKREFLFDPDDDRLRGYVDRFGVSRRLDFLPQRPLANSILTKFGSDAATGAWQNTCGTGTAIGVTSVTHALANERPRWEPYTRKVTIAASTAEIRFGVSSFTADPVEKSLSIDVYIDQMVSEFLVANPFITVNISNTTTLGSNYSRWTFDAGYLRQGWNTLKMRQADTISATPAVGNLPTGCAHPADVGAGFDWLGTGQFISMSFNNMDTFTVHLDALRRPPKAKPVFVIGFDASGASAVDAVFPNKVAPLFARYGIRSYCTMTYVYDALFAGGAAWQRLANLHNNFGWDVVNHTWNHGATTVGRIITASTVVRDGANLVTFTATGNHLFELNRRIRISIQGASPSDYNGIFEATVTGATTFTYTATGAAGSATGTIRAYTFLSEVLSANNAENLRILEHELGDVTRLLSANGFTRGRPVAVMPNNSVPEISLMETVCKNNGIRFVRAWRGGYAFPSEFGIDNPLNFGSFVMDSGASGTQTSFLQAKVQGAIDRGDHIWIFGHFILDDEDPANFALRPVAPDFPPAAGGNPNPPAGVSLSGFGGWWYLSQLRTLIEQTVGPAVQRGDLLVMSPSEYATYMNGLEV
jgi:hypothetical protein